MAKGINAVTLDHQEVLQTGQLTAQSMTDLRKRLSGNKDRFKLGSRNLHQLRELVGVFREEFRFLSIINGPRA